MTVLGFHGGSHCRPGYGDGLRAAGAAATFDDMRQLPGLIERMGQVGDQLDAQRVIPGCEADQAPLRLGISRFRVRCWRIAPE